MKVCGLLGGSEERVSCADKSVWKQEGQEGGGACGEVVSSPTGLM